MKTAKIKRLADDVLGSLPRPYTEHVIDDVFCAIEHNPEWRKRYDDICDEFGKMVANTWGGYWIANALGKVGEHQVPARRSTLIGSYSILDSDVVPPSRKPTQLEAAQMMSEYYQLHKAVLPAKVRQHREFLIDLIMEGMSPQQAFAMALDGAD